MQDAEESLQTLTEDRKNVRQQLGRIDQCVTDLKHSTSVSQSLMGTLLVKVGGVSQDEVNTLVQQTKAAGLAELPLSLDPQSEEKMRLMTLETPGRDLQTHS